MCRWRHVPLFAAVCLASAAPALVAPGAAQGAPHHAGPARSIEGSWQLVWPERPPSEREVKLITGTQFAWTTFDPQTHEVIASAGGGFTLVGHQYCEQLLYAQGSAAGMRGSVQCFEVRVTGDSLIQTRPPGEDGIRSREVWKRLR